MRAISIEVIEMTAFDFDTIYDRRVPGDVKYEPVNGRTDLIPLWVADMDFKTAPCVEASMNQVAERGIYGYQEVDEEYLRLVRSWYRRRFSYDVREEWILPSPGVMYSVSCAIRALTREGDGVLIFEPVYYPFADVIRDNRRAIVVSELRNVGGRYEIDFEDFARKLREDRVTAVLFCSPHNPVGRVWTREELERVAELCLRYGAAVISDEIHSDLVYAPGRHIPFASLSGEIAARTVTCVAPTKTFNLASVEASEAIISDPRLRAAVRRQMRANCRAGINTFAIAATKAVYRDGESWFDALLEYLDESRRILAEAFADSPIRVRQPEGTYLAWLDCRRLGLSDDELNDLLLENGRVRLHKGGTFGRGGNGFVRLNFACPHSILNEAIARIRRVI